MKDKLLGQGERFVNEVLAVDPRVVRKGKSELSSLPETSAKRIRKLGSGAKN